MGKIKVIIAEEPMDNTNKKNFKMLSSTDNEELEEKIKMHRHKILRRILLAIFIIGIILTSIYIYFTVKTFHGVKIMSTTTRSDTVAEKYEEFQGNILKYSNDGAFYTDHKNQILWNQTYEMQNPILDICEGYLAIADKSGTDIYIMDKNGQQGVIKTSLPIIQVKIAAQGSVAVLMKDNQTSYLQLYDKKGKMLASGELHAQNSGFPISIELSNDAKKMAISMLNIGDGKLKTTIAFYNFGSVGQNEIDNIVSSYSYNDEIYPQMQFIGNNQMIAYGDKKIVLFEGTQKPKQVKTISINKEIKSIFYNSKYFGLVYNNDNTDNTRHMDIYSTKGAKVLAKDFDMDYENIEFLNNNEICVYNAGECQIYSIYGIKRFQGTFDVPLYQVLSGFTKWNYTFISEGKTQEVRLK